MTDVLKGIAIPIRFKTKLLTRRQTIFHEEIGERIIVRDRMPIDMTIGLYFAVNPIKANRRDLLEPEIKSSRIRGAYGKNHSYGDHQFLVPINSEEISRYDTEWDVQVEFDMIAGNPTTTTQQELMQLLPCAKGNLDFLLAKVQSEPFYLAFDHNSVQLHIKDSRGFYLCLQAQN